VSYVKKLGLDPAPLTDNVIIVFTNAKADISIENSPSFAVTGEKLKEFLRKKMKENPVSVEWISTLLSKLPS